MKQLTVAAFVLLLAVSCTQQKNYRLTGESARWTDPDMIHLSGDTLLMEGEFKQVFFRPGLFDSFENFMLTAHIGTMRGANGGIVFHTSRRNPDKGYEVRVNNSPVGDWDQLLKTGSLSSIRNVYYTMMEEEAWFDLEIRVVENQVQIRINGQPVVHYTEPVMPFRTTELEQRKLGSGTFAVRSHAGNTGFIITDMQVTKLPGEAKKEVEDPDFTRQITQLHTRKFPVVDYHVHIKGELTMEEALERSARLGINYGIAANCGLKFPIQNDTELQEYLESIHRLPIFKAMQAEGREWTDMFSPELVDRFDYAFTDAMTWTNDRGTRMRLWIPEETDVGDPGDFMDQLVAQIEKIVTEPIAIYVNPTYLPAELQDRYQALWTDERIDRVVAALKKNNVALEINSRLELPGPRFIEKAKAAGVKFAMGTNNTDAPSLGRLDWAIEQVETFNLQPSDMYLPEKRPQE